MMKKCEAERLILKNLEDNVNDCQQVDAIDLGFFQTEFILKDNYIDEEDLLNYLRIFGILRLSEYRKIYKKEAAEFAKRDDYDESIQLMQTLSNYDGSSDDLLVSKDKFSYGLSTFNMNDLKNLINFEMNK